MFLLTGFRLRADPGTALSGVTRPARPTRRRHRGAAVAASFSRAGPTATGGDADA